MSCELRERQGGNAPAELDLIDLLFRAQRPADVPDALQRKLGPLGQELKLIELVERH